MEFIEVKNLSKYLFMARPIGIGTTAICFLMRDGRVLKVYLDTYRKRELFKLRNIKEHLLFLNTLNNESYIAPEEVITIDGEVVAYTMRFCPGKYVKRFDKKARFSELKESYEKLIEDTYRISEANFRLGDLHDKNIFYSDGFQVIDLDKGLYNDYYNIDTLEQHNMGDLAYHIISSMFGVGYFKNIFFLDDEIDEVYKEIMYRNYNEYGKLLDYLSDSLNISDPTVADLQKSKKKLIRTEKRTDYYGRYC